MVGEKVNSRALGVHRRLAITIIERSESAVTCSRSRYKITNENVPRDPRVPFAPQKNVRCADKSVVSTTMEWCLSIEYDPLDGEKDPLAFSFVGGKGQCLHALDIAKRKNGA